ncbi:hypothetical protein CR513_44709, partial [Mucuna pruriens]
MAKHHLHTNTPKSTRRDLHALQRKRHLQLASQVGRSAQVGEVPLRVQPLHGALPAEVFLHVGSHGGGYRHVTLRLHNTTGDVNQTQNPSQVAVENGSRHEQRDVGSHVEQRPRKFSYSLRNIRSHGQRRKTVHPRLVVCLHCRKHLLDLSLLESPMVVLVIQKPE